MQLNPLFLWCPHPCVGIGILLSGLTAIWPVRAAAQTLSPYSDFQAMSLADMDSLRVKLTYGGPQDWLLPTLVIAKAGTPAAIASFTPFRRSGFEYSNDEGPTWAVAATAQQLKGIIDSAGTVSRVTDGDVDPKGYVSFALLSTAGGATKVFEAIVNDTTGHDLFGRLLGAVQANTEVTRDVRTFGCDADMLPQNLPANVGSQATVTFTGLRSDRSAKNQFVGKVKVTNQSGSTFAAPLTLVVIRNGGNAKLIGDDGVTCNIHPGGVPFVNLSVGSGLAAGASVERLLRFANPSLAKFDVEFRVFAGPGTR
jgi:hypothetical protein